MNPRTFRAETPLQAMLGKREGKWCRFSYFHAKLRNSELMPSSEFSCRSKLARTD